MADKPKYGGTRGELDAAVAATNKEAAKSLENKARAAKEAEKAQEAESRAGERSRGVRKVSVTEIERQSKALEQTTSRLASETAAVNASTEAWLRNNKARAAAGVEGLAGARYGGATGDLSGAVAATRATENLIQKEKALQATATAAPAAAIRAAAPSRPFGEPGLYEQLIARQQARQQANQLAREDALRGAPLQLGSGTTFIGQRRGPSIPTTAERAGAGYDATKVSSYTSAVEKSVSVSETEAALRARSNALLQQSVGSYAASSQALQRHGALTAEFIQGLIRGEVTLKEFQSQLAITIGKFAGWAIAGGLVYGAYDAIKHVFTGLKETESGVEQLRRSLGEKVDAGAAAAGFRKVAIETNSTIREVADAQFYSSRVFHDQADSLALASTALRAYRLDQVNAQDAIKSFAAANAAFGAGPKEIANLFDILDVGQLKFNARLNQTLPQFGRAAASWAAAGGTLKGLADQLIQINRATGGGGGTGGGNPATALLREPANLYRPESEEVLRRYKFNPREAQTHVERFNQEVQERAPQLGEKGLQEIAKAAGAGAGVGFRYLLPLYRLGLGGLPKEEREATSHAGGSAAEDLRHRLSQADELVRRLGIDFETFGSQLAGVGLGPALNDTLKVLDLTVRGIKLLIDPFAQLSSVLTSIPGPLRDVLEAFAAYKGIQRFGRSGLGLAVRERAADSQFFPSYAGGGAPELRAVQSTQLKYREYLINQKESASGRAIGANVKAEVAARELEALRAAGPAAAGGQAIFGEREAAAKARVLNLTEAGARALAEDEALTQLITETDARIFQLKRRSLAVQERLLFAQAEGIYAAQPGSPNALPAFAPVPGVPRGGTGPLAQAAERQAVIGEAATAEAAVAASAASRSQGLYVAADAAVQRAGGAISGAFKGLKSFIGGLGILGKGIAAFVALDVINQLDGAQKQFEEGASRIAGLTRPSSEQDLRNKLKQVAPDLSTGGLIGATADLFHGKPGHEFEYLKAAGHDVIQAVQHPRQALEDAFGAEHPGTFTFDQRAVEQRLAKKRAQQLKEGRLKGLGEGGKLGGSYLEEKEFEGEEAAKGLEAGQSDKTIEKIQSAIAAEIKLRLEELKAFGTGKYGEQAIQQLGITSGTLAGQFAKTGDSKVFQELAKDDEQITAGVISTVQAHVSAVSKLAKGEGERQQAVGEGRARLQQRLTELYKPLTATSEDIGRQDIQTASLRRQLGAKPGDSGLTKALKASEEQGKKFRSGYNQLREKIGTEAQQLVAAEEAIGQEAFTSAVTPLRAEENVAKASAGADKQAAAEADLALIITEEGRANTFLTGNSRKEELLALQAKRISAEETVVTEKIGTLRAHSTRAIAELPLGDSAGKARLEVNVDRQVETLIRRSNLSPRSKAKQLYEAHTATIQAEKQAEETIAQEALAISNLNTQLAQARDTGNALAQAQDALRGAQAAAKLAKTPQARLQAQLDVLAAINQARQAQQQRIQGEGELAESQTTDPLKQAKIKVGTDRRLLAAAHGPDEELKARIALNNDLHRLTDAQVGGKEEDIEFQLKMQQISQQTAISQYHNLLSLHGLSKRTRRDILTKIRGLQGELGNNPVYDLSPTSIKLPTAYDVHRAILSASKNTGTLVHSGDTTQINQFTITVHDQRDVGKVADVLDRALGSGVHAHLRSAGHRGH